MSIAAERIERLRDSQTFLAGCRLALDEMAAAASDEPGVFAVLATSDGLALATTRDTSEPQANRIAAMASSLQALGAAVADEAQLGESNSVLVDTTRGRVVVTAVPGNDLFICAMSSASVTLGQVLFACRTCGDAIAAMIKRAAGN